MLFLMPREGVQTFWMKEMRFPLDMVWIGAGCRVTGVTGVTHDVPFPEAGTPASELPRYKSPDGPYTSSKSTQASPTTLALPPAPKSPSST